MLNIQKETAEKTLTLALSGRLDTGSAPLLETELKRSIDGVEHLVFDFKDLEYTSSAGLRVLLSAQKVMSRQGDMVLCNVNAEIMEVFEVTGFAEILTFA